MHVKWSLQHEKLDDFEPTIRSLYEIAFSTEKAARTIIFPSEKAFVKSCHKDWSEAQERIATEVIKLYTFKKEMDNEFKERRKFNGHNDAENKEHFKLICAIENRVKVLRRLADTIAQRVFDNKMWMAKRGLHPRSWTKYVRVVGRNQSPLKWEKGTCHEAPKEFCC